MIRFAEMFRWLGPGLLLSLLLISGCVSSQSPNSAIEVDTPKSNTGVLTSEGREEGLSEMAEALQLRNEFLLNHAEKSQQASTPKDIYTYDEFQKDVVLLVDLNADLATIGIESGAVTELGFQDLPADSSQLISLPGFSPTEIREVLEMIQLKAETEKAYRSREESEFSNLPSPPKGIDQLIYLTRSDTTGRRFIRCGVRHFLSQPDHLWIQGGVINENEDPTILSNSDLDAIPEWIKLFINSSAEQKKELHREDLEYALIQLSYIDIAGAMEIMAGFGVKTVDVPSKVEFPVPFDDLPMVAAMPEPTEQQTALLGAESSSKGAFDLSITPSAATTLPNDANISTSSQILVYYHPAHPIQLSKIKTLLRDFVDRPARQIFVEGMVLEISEDGLEELGVEWEFKEGNFEFLIGSINPNNPNPSIIGFDDLTQLGQDFWKIRLQALITEGKAEILSRPSVLTLNNRQATIRVGTDIPIATSQEGAAENSNKISFNFKYLATGISLNIRPRINESGDEVSMLVDTIVSSQIPGQDLELRSADGDQILASAPTIATRRIQTYARIRDNTPFIIG
ncbi:MAG TPA: hypothetical protein EYG38_18520, partial [Verrucomicrobia bacterium]|nr:hypothetical protein [Verrucomicrobiota bacterium]